MPDDSVYAPFSIARREDGSVIELGRGAMGITYKATDTQLGRTVALKVINATYLGDPIARQRFLSEARAAAQLHHSNVAGVFQLRAEGEDIFYAMEFVEGETVDARVRRCGPLPSRLALRIILQASQGLAAADARGLIHRDIKPANLMLAKAPAPAGEGIEHEEEDGLLVKVIDFGLAKNVSGNDSGGGLTGGNVVGTPYYMSPEQISSEGGGTVDCRSDIYSLGVTLWYLLLGRPPFEGSQFQILSQHLQKRPPLEMLADAGVPPEIVALVGSMLAKDREERPANHGALIAALKKFLRTGGAATAAPGHEDSSRVKSPDETMAMPTVSTDKKTSSILQLSTATWADEEFSIAVLPFKSSGGAKMEAFANGLCQDITTGLSRFRYLSVVARASATQLQGGDERVQGARYLLDGSIRQAGSTVRVSAKLIDARSDAQLWAETYDRDPKASGIFAVQDDIAARIVTTAADSYGVLVHAMASVLRQKDDTDLPPVAWQFQYFAFQEQVTPAAHVALRSRVERAVERDDMQSDLWASLAQIYTDEYAFGFGGNATSLDRALAAGRRAVELDRANQFALIALARVHFFRQDLAAFRPAAERAMALNPLNTGALGILGLHIVHTGEFERGSAIVRRAMDLNPNHAGWLHFAPIWYHFQKCEYEQALERANRVDVPGFFWSYLVVASACGHLGRDVEANAAVRDLLALDPEFAAKARSSIARWHFASGLMESILEGLRKAGLEIPSDKEAGATAIDPATVSTSSSNSGAARADEGFWVAVLPFKFGGNDAGLASLAEGLSEEIVTGLSRFSYLRVIARSSTSRYAHESVDVRIAGKELGARYVLEGSFRQAGTKLRLAVQVVDAISGAHLWAETYERNFSAESVFELQDDLVPRIVSTIADTNGILPRSMSEAVRSRPPEQLSPYESVLRSFGYFERVTGEDLAAARAGLESAVQKAPAYADAWAMLALLCAQEYGQGFRLQSDSLVSATTAARRAVELAPSNHLAHFALAQVFFFQKEFQSLRNTADRAIALNPMDGNSIAFLGEMLIYSGDLDRGRALAKRAKQLNPNHPGWYWYADTYDAYRQGDDRSALNFVRKANLPGHWGSQAMMAAACGQLGEKEAADKAVRELLNLRPDFAATCRREFGKWFDSQHAERLVEGLCKAGLDVQALGIANRSGPAVSAAVAIAVLPFADLSPNKDQQYLCEGMAEEIMNALVQIEGIRVASRTSAFRAKQNHIELPDIARALSVGYVLEGSVRTSGSRLRVTAQLTDVASGFQIWSERFDREAADIFAVQDEIATGVMEAVKARLAPGPKAIPARPRVKNLEAYQHFLEARHFRYTKNDHLTALRAYQKAVALDPSHAPSWVGVAEASVLAAFYSLVPIADAFARAEEAIQTAIRLHGDSPEACYARAIMAFAQHDWSTWEYQYRRALTQDPAHVPAMGSFGLCLSVRNRLDEAREKFQRIRELDPLAAFPFAISGVGLLSGGKSEESISYLDEALAIEGENSLALWGAGMANVALGRCERGIDQLQRAAVCTSRSGFILGLLGWALATAGRMQEARDVLKELRSRPAPAPTVVSEVWLLAALGDIEGAFEALARAEADFQPFVCFSLLPGYDLLRADPRFAALERRLGLEPSRVDVERISP